MSENHKSAKSTSSTDARVTTVRRPMARIRPIKKATKTVTISMSRIAFHDTTVVKVGTKVLETLSRRVGQVSIS